MAELVHSVTSFHTYFIVATSTLIITMQLAMIDTNVSLARFTSVSVCGIFLS